MVSSKCKSVEVLVSGQEAPCCPLGFFPPSGWPRSQTWSPQSLPVQRPAACLPGPLIGLAFPGDPSIMPAKWMQRAMAPLKRQTSPRLEECEGAVYNTLYPAPTPAQLLLPLPCCPLLVKGQIIAPVQDLPERGISVSANPSSDSRKLAYSPSPSALRFPQAPSRQRMELRPPGRDLALAFANSPHIRFISQLLQEGGRP